MGTKNNPGHFDCYANADPDEPMFILLARDKHAPTLVWLWAALREIDGEDLAKVNEARDCMSAMLLWQHIHERPSIGLGQAALGAVFELIRAANAKVPQGAENESTSVDVIRGWLARTTFEGQSEA